MTSVMDRLTQAGIDDFDGNAVRVSAKYHGKQRANARPHHAFKNWTNFYQLPWFCFIDVACFCLYILFATFHQNSAAAFSLDFSDTITNFFLKDIEITEPPEGIALGVGQIFFIPNFYEILNDTCHRLFEFPNSFPIAHPLLAEEDAKIVIVLGDGERVIKTFKEDEAEDTASSVKEYINDFVYISTSLLYDISFTTETQSSHLKLEVLIDFSREDRTDSVVMDISHTRFQEKFQMSAETIFTTLDFSIPLAILILNVFAVILVIKTNIRLYRFTKTKAIEIGTRYEDIFKKRFERWDIFALVTHLSSIITSIAYFFIGQDIEAEVPPIIPLLALASFMHSILLIRYLKLRETTFLIIRVFYKSGIKIMKFLVGCMPIYLAFLVFGVCFYGHLEANFASGMQCATFLFCVMHGDSIKEWFDAPIIQNDLSIYLGFCYAAFWVMFSLLIMFNITISIVQEVLTVETYKSTHKDQAEDQMPAFNLLSKDLAMMTSRRKEVF